jgi:two-component system chemotaxis response regulator CheB
VLVVDDSAYVRKVVREMLAHSPLIEIAGVARDGAEALQVLETMRPDVVISDLMMPELDGVGFVREQMLRDPIPIVVMSSADENSEETIAALDAGAVDFVQKPTAMATEKIFSMRDNLIETVKMAAAANPRIAQLPSIPGQPGISGMGVAPRKGTGRFDVVVIGISTGGPQALRFMIPQFPKDFPVPIVIVLHMPVGYTAMYAERLAEISELQVREAAGTETLSSGIALIAPAGKHLIFHRSPGGPVMTRLTSYPETAQHRPSVDVLFQSAAQVFGERTLGVVMTGMGSDGKTGSAWIKARGGTIFSESEDTCVVYGMPSAVAEAGLSDKIVRLERMSQAIQEAV